MKLTPIKPNRPFLVGMKQFDRALSIALDDTADYIKALDEKTVTTWSHSVRFYVRKLKHSRKVGTDDKIWNMLDRGTRPHRIRPKRASALKFKVGGFKAKTKRRTFASYGGAQGGEWRSSQGVNHPGTEARDWSVAAGERGQKELKRNIKRELDRILK